MIVRFGTYEPEVPVSAFVADTATVLGQVALGEEASVWYGSVLRGDVGRIEVGDRTNIQDLSVVHVNDGAPPTRIGNDVTVGHRAIVHGCVVQDRVLIGMGAVVLDDAVIGGDSLVAAGCIVPPGLVVPAGSLVRGVPGRIVRELSSEEKDRILDSALHYAKLAIRHREGARPG